MAGNLFVLPKQVPIDSGVVVPGAKATFTKTGTTTLQDTFTDIALTVAHANPVVADSNGVFDEIFFNQSFVDYRLKLTDANDVLIYQVDDVPASQSGQTLTLNSAAPFIDLIESDAAANNTTWRIGVNSEQLTIQLVNDALSSFANVLTIDRTANTIDRIALNGSIFLIETSAANADVAGEGQFWVENTTPNKPRFTDDTGLDYSLPLVRQAYKTADESATNDNTLSADTHLTLTGLAANTIFKIDAQIIVTCASATPDIQWAFAKTNSSQFDRMTWSVSSESSGSPTNEVEDFWNNVRSAAMDGTNDIIIKFEGIMHTHATLTTDFTFNWAQLTSNATATVVKKGSWVTALKFGTA